MTLIELKKLKIKTGYTYEEISALSGVPLSTVQKIFGGYTVSPRRKTLAAIEKALCTPRPLYTPSGRPGRSSGNASGHPSNPSGPYTTADYFALPDDARVELLDGFFYGVPVPSVNHQLITACVFNQLFNYFTDNFKEARLCCAPAEVRIDRDDKTILQPDICVYLYCSKLSNRCFDGPPDLTVEVLSSSTRTYDIYKKTEKYYTAKVREHWIVDPEDMIVTVHTLENNYHPSTYFFNESVPVGISGDKCRIDFKQVADYCRII